MNIYAWLVALVLITAFLLRGNREGNKVYVIVACLLLFAVFGLRNTYYIGGDSTSSYLHSWQQLASTSWGDVMNWGPFNEGFYLTEKLFFDLFNGDYQLFISILSAFVTICFGHVIYKYSPNPVQSILYHFGLLLFVFHFSALKQSSAMAILMLAFDSVIERKPFRFMLTVLIASQFHFPAMVFLAAYPLSLMKPDRSFLLLLLLTLGLTYLLREQILTLMLRFYDDNEISTTITDGVQFLRTKSLIMLVIVVVAVLLRKPRAEDRTYCTLLEFMGVAVIFQTFCGYNNIFERLADYYFQFSIIFIPMVFDKNADREPLFGWRLMGVIDAFAPFIFCGYGIYRFLSYVSDNKFYTPYRFFFQ
ncbi:MAG: EpsG family protein [Oscillospiraceae bacterium]|nr:EpsG family protein [Oscillospiraceae bacterium]